MQSGFIEVPTAFVLGLPLTAQFVGPDSFYNNPLPKQRLGNQKVHHLLKSGARRCCDLTRYLGKAPFILSAYFPYMDKKTTYQVCIILP